MNPAADAATVVVIVDDDRSTQGRTMQVCPSGCYTPTMKTHLLTRILLTNSTAHLFLQDVLRLIMKIHGSLSALPRLSRTTTGKLRRPPVMAARRARDQFLRCRTQQARRRKILPAGQLRSSRDIQYRKLMRAWISLLTVFSSSNRLPGLSFVPVKMLIAFSCFLA